MLFVSYWLMLQSKMVNILIEALQERLDLLLDRIVQAIRHYQSHIFLLVLLSDGNRGTSLLKFDHLLLAELIILDCELLVDDTGNVIVQHPLQRLVILRVNRFEITHVDLAAKDLFVECPVEVGIEQATVIDGFADDSSDKLEVRQVVRVDTVDTGSLVGLVCLLIGSAWLEKCYLSARTVMK